MLVKIKKRSFYCILILRNGEKNIPSQQLFLDSPNLFDSIFAGVVWIDKLYDCDRIIFRQQKQEKATF